MGNVVVGILMILGGASGQFVLKGTESSGGLMGLGLLLVLVGIVQALND